MDVEIIRMTAERLSILDSVEADVFDGPVDRAHLHAFIADPSHVLIVAAHMGAVVGQIVAMLQRSIDGPPELYVSNLGVAPPFRRRGIARTLIADAMAWGAAHDCATGWVVTESDNAAANALYAVRGGEAKRVALFDFALRARM